MLAPEVFAAGHGVAAPADALAADSTTEDDDLVCEWGPVEGQEGVWQVTCYRANDSANGGVCWYLVTYRCNRTGTECTKVHEEFLGCEGGEEECTEEQINIDREYDDPNLYAPKSSTRDWKCSDFKDEDITKGVGTHGHDAGFILPVFRTNRPKIKAVHNGLHVSSDWRCPQGNANLPNPGSKSSQHMEGTGGDFAFAGRDLTYDEWDKLRDKAGDLSASTWSAWGTPCEGCPWQYKSHFHVDWR